MTFLRLMLTAVMLCGGLSAQADEQAATVDVTFQRSADQACLDCHKEQTYGMHGKHGEATNPNNLAPVTCTNCHGHPSPKHREGVKDVMRFKDSFNQPQSEEGYSIAEQNGACMSCHGPDELRKSLWAHDVHATKLSCTSCHSLHPSEEPMAALPTESRVKLCVDCHTKQHAAVKAKAKGDGAATTGKETQ